MSIASRLRGAALGVALLAPLPSAAQQPAPVASAEGARELAETLRAWMGRQLAGIADLGAMPQLRVTLEGEAYRLELPLGGAWFGGAATVADAAAALRVKPLEGGRWQILGGGLPPRLAVEMKDPAGEPMRMTMTMAQQELTGTFDPSLAGASRFVTSVTGYATETQTRNGTQGARIARIEGRSEWVPSAPGRVTIQGDSQIEDYATEGPLPGGGVLKVTMARLGGSTRIENFDMDGLATVLRTAFALGQSAPAPRDGKAPLKPEDKAAALKLVGQMFALMDALETDYSYGGIQVDGGLFSGSLRSFGLGLSAGAPDGRVDIRLRLSAEGLESPMIPPGPWTEFIPHKVALTPRISGMPKDAAMALLRRVIETDGKDIDSQAATLLEAHPLALGIDDLLIDLGPMRLKGAGQLQVARLDDANGGAELRATGLDALIRRANAIPDLKMAAPVLIFLKGIGRQEGTETVWTITYEDRKVMVNDTDLSDLMPSK